MPQAQKLKKKSWQPTFTEFMERRKASKPDPTLCRGASGSESGSDPNVPSTSYCIAVDKDVSHVMEQMLVKLDDEHSDRTGPEHSSSSYHADKPVSAKMTDGVSESTQTQTSASNQQDLALDIADASTKSLSSADRCLLITNRVPPSSLQFPATKVTDSRLKSGATSRFCQHAYFQTFDFLTYSFKEDSVYCLSCALFPTRASNAPANLVTQGYRNWKKLMEVCRKHERDQTGCHSTAVSKMKSFLDISEDRALPIDRVMDKKLNEEVAENRNALRTILETLIFCGQQGLALRGHRDSAGKVMTEFFAEEEVSEETDIALSDLQTKVNPGNFLALLQFRVKSGDTVLASHLSKAKSNASYISNTTQNLLIDCIRFNIMEQLKHDIINQQGNSMFSVLADEVTDNQNMSQLGISIRYVDIKNQIQERCIGFTALNSMVGREVASQLLKAVQDLGLNPSDTVGLGFDGAGNMAGQYNGAQAHYRKEAPNAIYFHCASHSLNLALSSTTKQANVKHMIETLQKLGLFFKYSPKRQRVLTSMLHKYNEEGNHPPVNTTKIKVMCETRWVERHTNLVDFRKMYVPILETMENIVGSDGWDGKAKTDAQGLLAAITTSSFIVAFSAHYHLMGYTKQLSVSLQGSSNDVLSAYEDIQHIKTAVEEERTEASFSEIKACINELCNTASITLTLPRISNLQKHRENYPNDGPMQYYTRSLIIPLYDTLISQLSSRFSAITKNCVGAIKLLPHNVEQISADDLEVIKSAYRPLLPSPAPASFNQEYSAYYAKCKALGYKKLTSAQVLSMVNIKLYPNLYHVFKALFTFPVTSADVERANSALDFVKTCKRSVMGQDRFNALVLMYIHKHIKVNVESVIDRFASVGNRRLRFMDK